MTFDITWHMTLLLISISLELFFAAKHTPNKCVRGHGFSFLSQLTWEGCRFLCSCCSLSYPASQGWDWTVARCTRSLRLLQRSPLRPASPCSRPALPASRSAFALVTTELSGHHGVCVRVALILLHGPSVQGW